MILISSVELQVISKILTSDSDVEIDGLLSFDSSYYAVYVNQIEFIFEHRDKYGSPPDVFTFQAKFPDVELVRVDEPYSYLTRELKRNKKQIILRETFNKLKDLGSDDVGEAWQYLSHQCERAESLDEFAPLDLIADAAARSEQVVEFSQQQRIPTGFDEIDKLMYGGLSTVEELALIVARTNTGKTWFLTKMMESAQKNGFPVLYYSPEMQASYLGTRFDTWRGHFQNSQLYQGNYSIEYKKYITHLPEQETPAFVLEDKDLSDGAVTVQAIASIVKRNSIKLVIIDGLAYMQDTRKSDTEYVRYKNICNDLFRMSKQYGCAVVVAMQANRETKANKDDKGDGMPSLYEIEGSDHPARICTQAFSLRQVFDKHVLDVRLEKSRIANNQKPVLSYSWDVNTGNVQYLPGGDDDAVSDVLRPISVPGVSVHVSASDENLLDNEFDDDDDVEF